MHYVNNTQLAVQTSILSNRWKLVWKTLPFFTFDWSSNFTSQGGKKFFKFIRHCFSRRNHDSSIQILDLFENVIPINLLVRCVKYAILHNVQELSVYTEHTFDLSIFRSHSLKKLKLASDFKNVESGETVSWDLPALTTLQLIHIIDIYNWKFLESYLISLPALTDLLLLDFVLPNSLSLPSLTALRLENCESLQKVCGFPALLSLKLDDVTSLSTMTDFFSALVSLQSLSLTFVLDSFDDCFISCPQLLNLKIRTRTSCSSTPRPSVNIVVSSPKLRYFDSVGIFTITCGVSSLENVNIKLLGCFEDKTKISLKKLKRYYQRLTIMFPGLGGAKILTLDSETVQALSEVSDLLGHFPSPFYNLKYVKLPQGYKKSSLSSSTKSYLLGGSPGATIVRTLPQNVVLTRMVPVSLTARNVVFEEPSATSANELVYSQDIPKKVRVDSNYGLWQGYEVNSEFVDLLDLIIKKYPETFENFTSKSKKLCCTIKLNMLCTVVNDFRKSSMTKVSREMIVEYRELFADLQQSFNLKWLVSRLNFIEQLHFPNPLLRELHAIDSHIDDAKSNLKDLHTRVDAARSKWQNLEPRTDEAEGKLNDLKTLRRDMMTAIEDASESMDTILAASAGGFIGDDIFSGL